MIEINKIKTISELIKSDLDVVINTIPNLQKKLSIFSDEKKLKGDELTGWLGEIYAKTLYDGKLVDEKNEHDFVVEKTGERYAVKARKGKNNGWNETSTVSKIEGDDCPNYLLFIHFDSNYDIQNIWCYPWKEILVEGRFMNKKVRNEKSGYYFKVSPSKDKNRLVYSKTK